MWSPRPKYSSRLAGVRRDEIDAPFLLKDELRLSGAIGGCHIDAEAADGISGTEEDVPTVRVQATVLTFNPPNVILFRRIINYVVLSHLLMMLAYERDLTPICSAY